jgi:hypothetical protein
LARIFPEPRAVFRPLPRFFGPAARARSVNLASMRILPRSRLIAVATAAVGIAFAASASDAQAQDYYYAGADDGIEVAADVPSVAYVEAAPPAAYEEVIPPSPYPDWTWVAGYWHWDGYEWVWISGRWVRPRVGYVYVQPYYDVVGSSCFYTRGYFVPQRRVSYFRSYVRDYRRKHYRRPVSWGRPHWRDHRDNRHYRRQQVRTHDRSRRYYRQEPSRRYSRSDRHYRHQPSRSYDRSQRSYRQQPSRSYQRDRNFHYTSGNSRRYEHRQYRGSNRGSRDRGHSRGGGHREHRRR